MPELIDFKVEDRVATIIMNDGKANIMSLEMLSALAGAFEQARLADAIVVLKSGLPKTYSAGFDVKQLGLGDPEASVNMLRAGAELVLTMLQHPHPVVSVCEGHAYPMGAFLLLSSDLRVGATGEYRIGLNEVAIGIAVPDFALAIARSRMPISWLNRTALLGQMFQPADAVKAGFLDMLSPPDSIDNLVGEICDQLLTIDHAAHHSTKLRLRGETIASIRGEIAQGLLPPR